MPKKFLLIPLAIVLVSALIFGGCEPAQEVPKEIRIGSIPSLTGMFAGFGVGGAYGIQAAVDDINNQGGVYVADYGEKLPVKLIAANSESDPLKVGTLAEDMVFRDKVQFFASSAEPAQMRSPIAIIADRYKTPAINKSVYEAWEALKEGSETGFEYSWCPGLSLATPPPPGDPRYGKLGYTGGDSWVGILDKFGDQINKRVGCFASDGPDGRSWYEVIPSVVEQVGFDVLGEERNLGLFPMDTTDYTPIIQEWKDYGVEILWGNCPAAHFGTLWRQARALGFQPKIVMAIRAHLFYSEVNAWGGDLPLGVAGDHWWNETFDPELCPGIGDTTPMSLAERWVEDTGQRLNPNAGWSYPTIQILIDAIERAGTLDGPTVNKAVGETDLMTLDHLIKFDPETHFSWDPLFYSQWQKTDQPWVWECPVVFSYHDFAPVTTDFLFPIPYD